MTAAFLAAELYTDEAVALRERQHYAARLWHAVTASSTLADGQVMADQLLGMPLLLSRDGGEVRAFINRCPHRGMPFLDPADGPRSCRRLVCPYHGWTYDRRGRLRAAAREAEFIDPFDREAWPLASLPCQELAGVIWVAGGPGPLPLGDQLDLLLQQCPVLVQRPRRLLRRTDVPLRCNWKVAHDNTLDDYHVAIAHPQTLHREQGPVRHYRHALSDHASLLATPWGDGEFLTFGLAPWTHLLLWPDGRLALIQFPPLAVDRCRLDLWLLGDDGHAASADDWLAELLRFLEEDRCLVEGAQQGYASGLQPGPPHRLELRILQHQQLYARLMADSAP
ncbi:MAG: Rieske 2Fe-2S domain-containing protein, partial [Cyanobacteriota bacterium]|nr:Rieske 2Fe-2S domain-containing protein [Cyanobacteriota bacterium]